jgi:hypothetical protein
LIARQDGTASSTGTQGLTPLPDNIPDLMLSYLNELNRDVNADKLDNRIIQEDAKALAWECLKGTYRPATAKRKDAIAIFSGDDAEARLKYLEDRLRLIQTIGPAQDQIRFALDPLAEYLAALQLIENYGKNQGQWRKFLTQAATLPGAPAAIQGFLLAVHDCCLRQGAEIKVPNFVAQELRKQVGLASPTGQTQMAQRP